MRARTVHGLGPAAALVALLAALAVTARPAAAITIDPGHSTLYGNTFTLDAVSCPTVGQCTGVDNAGHAVTYSPVRPHHVHRITLGRCSACTDLVAIDCPAANQCTAASQLGGTYTFSPRGRANIRHGRYGPVSAVACPSSSECVVLDGSGHRRTIDPRTPRARTVTQPISAGVGLAVACPLTSQCTNTATAASTFDPRAAPATPPVAAPAFPIGIAGNIGALDCPSRYQCTAVNFDGSESTFNPRNPAVTPVSRSLGHHYLTSISCPTAGQCTTVDSGGTTLTFSPRNRHGHVRHLKAFKEGTAVDCPSASLCTVAGGQFEVSVDPR